MNHMMNDNDGYARERCGKRDFVEHRNRFGTGFRSNENNENNVRVFDEQRILSEFISTNPKSLSKNLSTTVASISQKNENISSKWNEEKQSNKSQSLDESLNITQNQTNQLEPKSSQFLPDLLLPYILSQPISFPNRFFPHFPFPKSKYSNVSPPMNNPKDTLLGKGENSWINTSPLSFHNESHGVSDTTNLPESEQQTFNVSDQNVPIDLSLSSKKTLN